MTELLVTLAAPLRVVHGARDQVIPTLVAAFGNPRVRAAHVYEVAAVVVVLVLMLSRPF